MNVLVFIKEIPNSNNVKIDPKTNNLIRSNESGRINPFDLYAIETALNLKDKYGAHVSVISMGPPSFMTSLREALAMGVDEAYLLSSRAFAGSDTLATAYTLAQAVRKIKEADVLLFGLKAIDADTGQVPPLIAEELGLVHLTSVSEIKDLKEDTIDVKRVTDTAVETVRVGLPVVLSVLETENQVRYMSPRRIKNIMQEEITVWNEADLDCDNERIGMKGSPTIVTDTYIPETKSREVKFLEGNVEEAVSELIYNLKERHLI